MTGVGVWVGKAAFLADRARGSLPNSCPLSGERAWVARASYMRGVGAGTLCSGGDRDSGGGCRGPSPASWPGLFLALSSLAEAFVCEL